MDFYRIPCVIGGVLKDFMCNDWNLIWNRWIAPSWHHLICVVDLGFGLDQLEDGFGVTISWCQHQWRVTALQAHTWWWGGSSSHTQIDFYMELMDFICNRWVGIGFLCRIDRCACGINEFYWILIWNRWVLLDFNMTPMEFIGFSCRIDGFSKDSMCNRWVFIGFHV